MKKIMFEGYKCHVAYKVFERDMMNYRGNYKYEVSHWYASLDVDLSDNVCSYGCNLFKTKEMAQEFMSDGIVYKCYVPIKKEGNKIKFIEDEYKFRCQLFYLSDEEIKKYDDTLSWEEMNEDQRNLCCQYRVHNLNVNKLWKKMNEDQRNLCCHYQIHNLDVEELWKKMIEHQRDWCCRYQIHNLDINKLWNEMTMIQRDWCKFWYILKI